MAGYSDEVKRRARELDPECWVSYSGQTKAFKSYTEARRTESLKKAQREFAKNAAMPQELAKFLTDLSGDGALEAWRWLDEQPYAVEQMIDLLAETLPPPQAGDRKMSNKTDTNFFKEFKQLGGDLKYSNDRYTPEGVHPFMVHRARDSGSGPYVFAADYFLLLKLYQELTYSGSEGAPK